MLPNFTIKSAGKSLAKTPFQHWYFLFQDQCKDPIAASPRYYEMREEAGRRFKDATEDFARQLLKTKALKDFDKLDINTVSTLVQERKEADDEKAKIEAKKAEKKLTLKLEEAAEDAADDYFRDSDW